jgi:hypothetical protein
VSRAILLALNETEVREKCLEANVGVSAIERLLDGGVRLVCMSGHGADLVRSRLKRHLIEGEAVRERHRPRTPLW